MVGGIERRHGQVEIPGAIAGIHDLLGEFPRRHLRGEAVQQDVVPDHPVRHPSDRFGGDDVVHGAFHRGHGDVASHETLFERHNGKVFVLLVPEQFRDVTDVHDGLALAVRAVESEAAAVVRHDQRVVLRATLPHAPVEERLQRRDAAGVPFLLEVRIVGVRIRVRVQTVEVHPLDRDGGALAVAELADACVGPVAIRDRHAFRTVHQEIDFHVFREDRRLHEEEFLHEAVLQVVVRGDVDEDAPGVVLRVVGIRQVLRDQGVFAVLVIGRRIQREVVIALRQPVQADLGVLPLPQDIAGGVPDDVRHALFPVAAVIRQDDLAALPRVVFQHDLERVFAGLVLFHGLRDGEAGDGLVLAEQDRLVAFVRIGRDQRRIRDVPAQRVVVRDVVVSVNADIILADVQALQADHVVDLRRPGIRHHVAVGVQDLDVQVAEGRLAGQGDGVVGGTLLQDRESVVVDVLVTVDGEPVERLLPVQGIELGRLLHRVVRLEPVGIHLVAVDVEHELIATDAGVFRLDRGVIHSGLESGHRDALLPADGVRRGDQQRRAVPVVQEEVEVAELVVVAQRDHVADQPLLRQDEHVIIRVVGAGDVGADRDLALGTFQEVRGRRVVAGLVVVDHLDGLRQVVDQLVLVQIAVVARHFQIVRAGREAAQGQTFVVRHAAGVVDQLALGIVETDVQVAGPLLEVDADVAGLPAGRLEGEPEVVDVRAGMDRQGPDDVLPAAGDHRGGLHGVVRFLLVRGICQAVAVVPADLQLQLAGFVHEHLVVVASVILGIAVDRAVRQFDAVDVVHRDDAVEIADGRAPEQPLVGLLIEHAGEVLLADLRRIGRERVGPDRLPQIERDLQFRIVDPAQRNERGIRNGPVRQIQMDGVPVAGNAGPGILERHIVADGPVRIEGSAA